MSRVLIIAVHPDDETLGCGGTLNRFNNPMSGILNRIPIPQTHIPQRIHQTTTDHLRSYSTSP